MRSSKRPPSTALAGRLWDRRRIPVTPIVRQDYRGIRVTPNIYSTLAQIEALCGAVEEFVKT